MKRFMNGIFLALVIGAIASISAFGGDKSKGEKKNVTFPEDVTVNGTMIKAGDYQVQFDETTGELAILKDGKVKAKTAAHVEPRSTKAKDTAVRTRDEGGMAQLIGLTFSGSSEDVIVSGAGSATGMQ